MELPQLDDYARLFLDDVPLLDVRAPVEFGQGAFPMARNIPILNDDERQAVGTCYKEQGSDDAVTLGHELVSGELKAARVAAWVEFVRDHPEGVLYCFRGGMRSKITQQWIFEASGVVYPRVRGGYKALRRFLLDELERSVAALDFTVLSGRTGVGKTELLHRLDHQIDLEGIYRHYGSAFGRMPQPQPSQIDVENELAIALLKQRQRYRNLVIEDESANIGSRRLPVVLKEKMNGSPVVVLEAPRQARIELIFRHYVVEGRQRYQTMLGEEAGTGRWAANLFDALSRIERRLGGSRYAEVRRLMEAALARPAEIDFELHSRWIDYLLTNYYDVMYDYQLEKKADRIIFRGAEAAVLDYLNAAALNPA